MTIVFVIAFGDMSSYAANLEEAVKWPSQKQLESKVSVFYQYKSAEKQLKFSGLTTGFYLILV